jgi:acyl-CoA dehydrogenase
MNFEFSEKVLEHRAHLERFMNEHIYPVEDAYYEFVEDDANLWQYPPFFEGLKDKAKEAGIWNWFLPKEYGEFSPGLSNLEFAPLMEVMARVPWAQEVFNCSAPDRGNMEVLAKYGTKDQQDQWLRPLLDGEIRSGFAMTEPQVASSDATNIETSIVRDGDEYVINGRKWWTTGAINDRCKFYLVMGKTDPNAARHQQQSVVLVPRDTPGAKIVRALKVFGGYHSPGGEGELRFEDCRVPVENIILGEGRGFEVVQGRLGPGRFQYAMMLTGMAQRCLELMCERVQQRVAFGSRLSEKTSIQHDIARSRCEIEQCRLLVLLAADKMDREGPKAAKDYISMVKIVAPQMAHAVSDRALQAFGGMGVSQDTPISHVYILSRFCQIADGPNEVHMSQLGKLTMRGM